MPTGVHVVLERSVYLDHSEHLACLDECSEFVTLVVALGALGVLGILECGAALLRGGL